MGSAIGGNAGHPLEVGLGVTSRPGERVMSTRNPTWLWWLAFFILFFGGLIAYMLSLQSDNLRVHDQVTLTLAITIVAAGICIICATADWWMQH